MTIEEYLAYPAVSASDIVRLMQRCPRAAWYESYLNPNRPVDESSTVQDIGSIVHALFLEDCEDGISVIDPSEYPSKQGAIPTGWTNNSIREARDAARAEGKTPILLSDMDAVEAMLREVQLYVDSLRESEPFVWAAMQPEGGESEVTITWEDKGGFLCKIRPDRISVDNGVVVHYKTGKSSAEPSAWGKGQLTRMGFYMTDMFYRHGIDMARGIWPRSVFLVQEQEPPYLCSLVGLDPAGEVLGTRKILEGLSEWRECVESGHWPGYPNRVCYPELPAYEAAWEPRED